MVVMRDPNLVDQMVGQMAVTMAENLEVHLVELTVELMVASTAVLLVVS